MPLLYNFDIDTPEELLIILAQNLQQRRLEKGLSRDALSTLSGIPRTNNRKVRTKAYYLFGFVCSIGKSVGIL